jgi:hypothetical protein
MVLTIFWIIWGLLALTVLAVFLYRQKMAINEDDSVHLAVAEGSAISAQEELGKKLDAIDKWGKLLTIVAAVTFVILAGAQVYALWVNSNVAIH